MSALPHPPSYWAATAGPSPFTTAPLAADRTAEVAVIGAGYTGLAAAYHLAGTHRVETVVLEAHRVGWGASGRNGGFAMPGLGKLDLGERIAKWGRAAARRSLEIEVESVAAVKALIDTVILRGSLPPAGEQRFRILRWPQSWTATPSAVTWRSW